MKNEPVIHHQFIQQKYIKIFQSAISLDDTIWYSRASSKNKMILITNKTISMYKYKGETKEKQKQVLNFIWIKSNLYGLIQNNIMNHECIAHYYNNYEGMT